MKSGFTLIELVIVVSIVAILAAIAIPLFTEQIRKGNRTDGKSVLLSIVMEEEKYRTNNVTYGTLAQVWGGVSVSPQGFYNLAISGVSGTGYTVTATAIGDQANDAQGATNCGTLTITVSGLTTTRTPAACW